MTQNQQNITTLLIPDPNGGQPQMIKVMGGKGGHLPIQLTGVSAGGSGSNVKATFVKTSNDQGQTVLQTSKLPSGQIIAIPAKQGQLSAPNIRGNQVVLPVSSAQLKSPLRTMDQQQHHTVVTNRSSLTTSPVVIRTQTGSLTANPVTLQTQQTTQSQVHHQQQHQQSSTQVISNTPPKSLITTPILDHSGARKRHDFDFDYGVESKRRKSEKGGKGLRHFSMKVCEKVKAKGTTSYNEVADELVSEFTDPTRCASPSDGANYDQKNIRRRVYDALNVLMAMNIISKEKKEIRWLGLPTNSAQECRKLEQERHKRVERIKLKTQQLQDLILQQIAFKNLVGGPGIAHNFITTDLAEGNHEPKLNLREDLSILGTEVFGEEDLEVGTMTRTGSSGASSGLGVISRHSSLISLQNEHRPDSASPSSFGDEEDEDMLDDSDVDIS
nr:uncharacterized protein LOC128690771 [Cherax quadricarinatus]